MLQNLVCPLVFIVVCLFWRPAHERQALFLGLPGILLKSVAIFHSSTVQLPEITSFLQHREVSRTSAEQSETGVFLWNGCMHRLCFYRKAHLRLILPGKENVC